MADIPTDIARLILGRLCLEDQVRFRSVCRSWHGVRGVKPRCEQPWLFIYRYKVRIPWIRWSDKSSDSGVWSYILYNPSTGKSYPCHVTFPTKCGSHPSPPPTFKILASSSGLLLMCSKSDRRSEQPFHFLFSPFSRRFLCLPRHATTCPFSLSIYIFCINFEGIKVMARDFNYRKTY